MKRWAAAHRAMIPLGYPSEVKERRVIFLWGITIFLYTQGLGLRVLRIFSKPISGVVLLLVCLPLGVRVFGIVAFGIWIGHPL